MKRTILSFLIIALALSIATAQPIRQSTYETMLKVAEQRMDTMDYYHALEWYEKAYEEEEDRSLLPIIADLHYKLRDYQRAERFFSRVLRREEDNPML